MPKWVDDEDPWSYDEVSYPEMAPFSPTDEPGELVHVLRHGFLRANGTLYDTICRLTLTHDVAMTMLGKDATCLVCMGLDDDA